MHNKILNRYYFINKFDQSHLDKQNKNTIIIFRNYVQPVDEGLILKLKNYCKKKGNKFLLSNDIKLAIKLDLDGAYIPSFNKDKKHLAYSLKKEFIILGSSHNIYEIRTKELQNVAIIFLSSIFKKNKNYLGINRFKLLSLLTKKPFIALGGISNTNLKKLNLTNCAGFAGISFFE
ncbi:thiamine phosphate synthase [Candidatus Pelagibacter ubique]|jgi:thiamine-phosphate pyrophosphorylase|nr:thiamine phosphate synthase [Nitrosomonadales bacterium]MDA7442226.1 thiamine phosphate synthase [Candidatus Pelagibacter ubique]MDC0562178.1 thiamine phosphate synthase [Candidatus Pelagibacter ubique]MDC1207676.1 thiamine phosphate synthase [Candidatus Pelagibacter ubique]